jgi:aryl-alcohol dehydrogenase-like predicted oxidoreductase
MEQRTFGRTGLRLSLLGFGCGAVGGLFVRGEPRDQERALARALELGINYFDTAAMYGNGASETHLGRVLKSLKPDLVLGTKVRLAEPEKARIGQAIAASLEASLKRLGRDGVDLFQLHNHLTEEGGDGALTPEIVLDEVVPAFERLKREGKIRFFGITAVGDTKALKKVVAARAFDSAQIVYNLLNPSAGASLPAGFPAHDFESLLRSATDAGMGVIGIRALAAGALSGSEARHPLGAPSVAPIASGTDYRADVERARRLLPLIREGYAGSLVEAALRFVIANEAVTTMLVGYSSFEQLETAAAAVAKGPLSPAALERLAALQQGLAGEKG